MLAAYISPLQTSTLDKRGWGKAARAAFRHVPVTLFRVIWDVVPSLLVYRTRIEEVLV